MVDEFIDCDGLLKQVSQHKETCILIPKSASSVIVRALLRVLAEVPEYQIEQFSPKLRVLMVGAKYF